MILGTVDEIVSELYASISGPAGVRNWDRLRRLFAPGARMIPTSRDGKQIGATALDVEGFIARATLAVAQDGFYEQETSRREERYGPMVHVWSTYACRRSPSDPAPFMRGVNSIQLLHDGNRYWVISIYWADARVAGVDPP
jgi:hypothetical protein